MEHFLRSPPGLYDSDEEQFGGKRSIAKKYIPDKLSKKDRKIQKKQIKKSRKLYKNKKYFTRKKVKSFTSKKSKHILKAEKIYNKYCTLKKIGK